MMVNPAYRGGVAAAAGQAGIPGGTVNGPAAGPVMRNPGYSPGGVAAGAPPAAAAPGQPPNPMQLQMLKDIASTQGPDAAHAAVAAAAPQIADQVKQVSGAMGGGAPPGGASPPVGSFGPGPEMLKAMSGAIAGAAPPTLEAHLMNDIGHFPPDVSGKGSTYPQDAWGRGQTQDAWADGRAPGGSPVPKPPQVPGATGMRDPNAAVPGAPAPLPQQRTQAQIDKAATGQWRGSARFARQRAARSGGPPTASGMQPQIADKGTNQDPNANRDALIAQLRARLGGGGGPAGGVKPQNIAY